MYIFIHAGLQLRRVQRALQVSKEMGTFEDLDNLNASISKLRAETPSRAGD